VVVAGSSLVQYICLCLVYLKKTESENLIEKLYNCQLEYGTKAIRYLPAIRYLFYLEFLYWVSPCTVWASNFAINTVGTVGLMNNVNPPITHCYNDTILFNATNYQFYNCSNSSHQLLNICRSGHCLPTICICYENESLFGNLDFLCFMIGVLLLFISLVAAACLQCLGSYYQMYRFASKLHFCRLFMHFVNGIATV
jgi:hypothetical protein